MDKFKFFWDIIELCDWNSAADDDRVTAPVVDALSLREDSDIFAFDDMMAELLYSLDIKELGERYAKAYNYNFSDDGFLYSRCAVIVNGPEYYDEVIAGKHDEIWDMEFDQLIYIPAKAWAVKHGQSVREYPHTAPLSYETGSNSKGWGQES